MAVLADTRKPSEGVRHEQPHTTLYVGTNNIGSGILYITDSAVIWLSVDASRGKDITLKYEDVILHAVSRELTRFPHECLYLHTDVPIPGLTEQGEGEESGDEDEMLEECRSATELFFVPEDKSCIDTMFFVMNSCQALNSDPVDESPAFVAEDIDDGYEEYEMYGAHSRLRNLQLNGTHDEDVEMDPEIFEDAEDA